MTLKPVYRRGLVVSITAFAVLAPAPGSAEAKFSSARVCGRSDCRRVTLANQRSQQELFAIEGAVFGGSVTNGRGHRRSASPGTRRAPNPPAAAPWYRVTLC